MGNKSCSRMEEYEQNEAKGQKLTMPSPPESIYYTKGCYVCLPRFCMGQQIIFLQFYMRAIQSE